MDAKKNITQKWGSGRFCSDDFPVHFRPCRPAWRDGCLKFCLEVKSFLRKSGAIRGRTLALLFPRLTLAGPVEHCACTGSK